MSMLYRVFLFFCLSITTVTAEEVEPKALQWLQSVSQAMKSLDYKGTVAFFKNGRLDTMKYFHAIEAGKQQERLLSLNSPMREVIREAGTVRCVFKKSKEIVVNHRPVSDSFLIDLPDDLSGLGAAYQLQIRDEESVVMLPVYVVSIVPKDQYRYERKIWIDKESFLPLKTEVYDLSGATVEQVVFTDIKVGEKSVFIDVAEDEKDAKVKHLHKNELLAIDQASFLVQNLPQNFQQVFFTRMNTDDAEQSVEHLLLSDGFSSVSVYKETKAKDAQEGLQTLGSVKSFTQIIDNHQITVLGEVPVKTVKFIAQGIKLK